jgi:hypothetical protein
MRQGGNWVTEVLGLTELSPRPAWWSVKIKPYIISRHKSAHNKSNINIMSYVGLGLITRA